MLDAFYREAEDILSNHLKERFVEMPSKLLHEAVNLNHRLVKLP